MFKKSKIKRFFVSPIDQILKQFDQTHAPNTAQQAEIKKYRRIALLRDKNSNSNNP